MCKSGLTCKYFCWSILLALITWIVTMFLYLHLTKDTINKNVGKSTLMSYTQSPENAQLGIIPSFGIIRNMQDQYVRDMGYQQHAFNALVSNNIGVFRDVPDTRHKICQRQTYDKDLPSASVVMCFYNEHRMALLRSVKSIMERTPPIYLKEIILVDDFSDYTDLKSNLSKEIYQLNINKKIKIVRNSQREGLIRARVIGARRAKGDVIVFLDSHIEVNQDWLQPLLHIIKHENSTLAIPVIDIINADTFEYTASPLVRGGFNWGLHFKWENLPEGTLKDESSFAGPFKSPTMAGGLFAVNRKYFSHIGEYDIGMDIWGGENLEISFRVWQCGGSIKILPCSRVGHIFRKRRPYSSPDGGNTMTKNSLRLAYVWMDEFKNYYISHEKIKKDFYFGDIEDRKKLRKSLGCHNFSWYMQNVYPELYIPGSKKKKDKSIVFQPWHSRKRTYINSYLLRLSNTELCASVVTPKLNGFWKKGSEITLQSCLKTKNQIWYETEKSELILDKLLCLEATLRSNYALPVLGKCHEMLGDQQWRHTRSGNGPIYNMATGTCLKASTKQEGANVILDLCTKTEQNTWNLFLLKK